MVLGNICDAYDMFSMATQIPWMEIKGALHILRHSEGTLGDSVNPNDPKAVLVLAPWFKKCDEGRLAPSDISAFRSDLVKLDAGGVHGNTRVLGT